MTHAVPIEPAAVRSGSPRFVRWPCQPSTLEHVVALLPLTCGELDAARTEADALWAAQGGRLDQPMHALVIVVAVLSRALRAPGAPYPRLAATTAELAAHIGPHEAAWLIEQWVDLQAQAMPDFDELKRAIQREMVDGDGERLLDGIRAGQAESAAAFFGCSGTTLRDSQLCYFAALRAAHETMNPEPKVTIGKDGTVRRAEHFVSRRALERTTHQ